jgi:hypothetical protein
MIDLPQSNGSIIDIDSKVSPVVLAGILGINVSLIYQNAQQGIIPVDFINYSYRDILQRYIAYYKKNVELKIVKEQADKEVRIAKEQEAARLKEEKFKAKDQARRTFDGDNEEGGGLHPLVAAKLKQEIRLNRVKEEQLLLRNSIERGEYVSMKEIVILLEPYLQAIKNNLVSIASDVPEVQSQIDQNMENLYNLGIAISQKAGIDSTEFVQKMLDKELDISEIEIDFTRSE